MRRDVSPRGKLPCCRADHMLFWKQEDDFMKRYISLVALMAAFSTPAAAQSVAPALGAAVAPAPLLVPMTAEGFRAMALQSDAFEISSSQLALQRSRNPAVRSFARQMVQDHSMTSQALGVPAGSAVALDARHASMLNQLAPLRACPGASESTLRWRGPVLVRNGAGLACRNDRR